MMPEELLKIAKEAGDAILQWEELQKNSGDPLDSANVVISNNQRAIRAYTQAGKAKQLLLDAARAYALSKR